MASPTASTSADNSSPKRVSQETKRSDSPSAHERKARVADGDESKKPAEQVRPTTDLPAQLDGAVFLIVAEKADHYWPHATCVAVGKDTLLTTAFDATDLAKMRDKDSFKIWVTRPAESSLATVQVRSRPRCRTFECWRRMRVLSEKPESTDLLFVNIGLLTVEGPLPKIASLASSKELDAVDEGFPVHCFGFTHEGQTNDSLRLVQAASDRRQRDVHRVCRDGVCRASRSCCTSKPKSPERLRQPGGEWRGKDSRHVQRRGSRRKSRGSRTFIT